MHFNPYFSQVYSKAKVGIKMHALSSCSSQLLVSVLFIAVPTNTENSKFFLTLVYMIPIDCKITKFSLYLFVYFFENIIMVS